MIPDEQLKICNCDNAISGHEQNYVDIRETFVKVYTRAAPSSLRSEISFRLLVTRSFSRCDDLGKFEIDGNHWWHWRFRQYWSDRNYDCLPRLEAYLAQRKITNPSLDVLEYEASRRFGTSVFCQVICHNMHCCKGHGQGTWQSTVTLFVGGFVLEFGKVAQLYEEPRPG